MATLKTLVSFDATNGADPEGNLIEDAAGDLFGTTADSGPGGDGTVFEIVNTATGYGSTPTTLVAFDGIAPGGDEPEGGLIADSSGNLFGTTSIGGGGLSYGSVFEIANTASGYAGATTLASFDGPNEGNEASSNGAYLKGNLVADAAGDLFGTTSGFGPGGNGTVFEIVNTATGYASAPTTLVSFNATNGSAPVAGLIKDSAGDLFGTTSDGGTSSYGTVFEIVNSATGYASTPTTLVNFNYANGAGIYPLAGLTMDSAGNLFGTTSGGGEIGGINDDDGTVFELARTATGYASTPTTLVSFNGSDGSAPVGGLIEDAAGDLFGTTSTGGADGYGTVFEIANTATGYASTPTTLVSFNVNNGDQPNTSLIADAAGDLFGTTLLGGAGTLGTVFEITDSGFAVCFLSGTRIATPDGERPVEHLAESGFVLNHRGQARRIVWIGKGRVLATRGRRNAATPVIVKKNAVADNVPHRDLHVTKAHSLYIDDVLIPVEFLVNHRTVLWDDHAQEVELYHIELETHDVLLANGAPAESFRDDGNRWLFQNASSGRGLPPQEPYAPVLTGGAVVDAVWHRLMKRSGPRPGVPMTADPDLHLIVNGQRVNAAAQRDALHIFRLAAPAVTARIASRAAVPQELGLARDSRCLGVALRQITVSDGRQCRTTQAAATVLADGFHGFEPDDEIRWTNGDAIIPECLLGGFTGPLEITLLLGGSTTYIDDGIPLMQRRA